MKNGKIKKKFHKIVLIVFVIIIYVKIVKKRLRKKSFSAKLVEEDGVLKNV